MVVFVFSTVSVDSTFVILYFLEDVMFLGKSNSSMVSITFTMSAMTWHRAKVISQSLKINFLISCSNKVGVLRFVSGVNDHFEHVVGVILGVLPAGLPVGSCTFRLSGKTRNLILSSSIDRASWICGINEPAPLPCECLTNVLRCHVSV